MNKDFWIAFIAGLICLGLACVVIVFAPGDPSFYFPLGCMMLCWYCAGTMYESKK